MHSLFLAQFKTMYDQKTREYIKNYENQQKRLQALKKSGKSAKQAEEELKTQLQNKQSKQQKSKKTSAAMGDEDDAPPAELLQRIKEYQVKFIFPETSKLPAPLLTLEGEKFGKLQT